MKKKILKVLIGIGILVIYLIIGKIFHIYIECPIHKFTGYYCPGCGLTRMLYSIIRLDFYQAFRYNPLLFTMTPFIIFLYINKVYSEIKNKKNIINKIPNMVWYIILFILIIYGILRNIVTYLEPTII